MILIATLVAATLTSPTQPTVLYVGDSVAVQNAGTLKTKLAAEFHDATLGGTGICDYLADTPTWLDKKFDALVKETRPDIVILQFWGNDFYSPCVTHKRGEREFYDQYFWNALSARREIDAAADAAGISRPKLLWVLQSPMPYQKEVPRRLNEIYQYAADLSGDRTTDAGQTVSMAAYPYEPGDRYEFTRFLPCTEAERGTSECTEPESYGGVTRLHADNDDIHFCLDGRDPAPTCAGPAPGIRRYVERIAQDARSWFALT